MKNYLAQKINIGGIEIEGPLKPPGRQYNVDTIGGIITILTNFVYPLATILLFIYLAWGGFDFLLGRGNPEKVKAGRAKLTAAVVGFILLMISYLLVRLIVAIFGLPGDIFG